MPVPLSETAPTPANGTFRRSAEYASTWRTWLPFAFVVFSLLALLVVPFLVERRVDALRDEVIQTAEPARARLDEIQLSIAQSAAAVRGLGLSEDPEFAERYAEALHVEVRAFDRLIPLLRELRPALADEALELRDRTRSWHAGHREALDARAADPESALRPSDVAGYNELLEDAAQIELAVAAHEADLRGKIQRTERIGLGFTLVLTLFALISAAVVASLGSRFRRRALEEKGLRDAALTLTEAVNLEDVLHRIARSAVAAGYGEASYVERIDAGEVEIVASAGPLAPPLGTRIPYPGSLTEHAVESGTPERVDSIGAGTRPVAELLKARCSRCSALVLPLIVDERAHGALVILRERGAYRDAELAQPRLLAVLAALALRKAVLLRNAQEGHRELQQVMESRARLIRGFTHDVKNPLGAADGHAVLLEEGVVGGLSPKQLDSVRRIRGSISSALQLIDDLVELARAEAGQLEIHRSRVRPAALLEELAEAYRAAAEAAGLRLEYRLDGEVPDVETDVHRVRQVLSNLLSNGVKYTPSGGTVVLSASARAGRRAGDPPEWIDIAVTDDGPGIPLEKQKMLFREFTRLEPDVKTGAGLGLAISQRIAGLLGGEISVDSTPGAGSTFTLSLPRQTS